MAITPQSLYWNWTGQNMYWKTPNQKTTKRLWKFLNLSQEEQDKKIKDYATNQWITENEVRWKLKLWVQNQYWGIKLNQEQQETLRPLKLKQTGDAVQQTPTQTPVSPDQTLWKASTIWDRLPKVLEWTPKELPGTPIDRNIYDDKGNITWQRSQAAIDSMWQTTEQKTVDVWWQKRNWTLWQEELDLYNTLTPEQQKQFWIDADKAEKAREDVTKAQMKTLTNFKKEKEFTESQRAKTLEARDITNQIEWIQDSAKLKQVEENLAKTKQNLGVIGTMWRWMSIQAVDAMSKQIVDAQKEYQDYVKVQELSKQLKDLWIQMDAAAYEKWLDDLQSQLDNQVTKTIQNAFNEFTSAELKWELDTVEKVDAYAKKLYDKMDEEINWYAQWNLQQRQFLLDSAKKNKEDAIKKIQTYQENAKKVVENKARWYYEDWNWKPLIWTDGAIIKIPEKAPVEPIYDKEKWQLITFSKDKNGQIVWTVQQIIDEPTFTTQTIDNYARLINNWVMTFDDLKAIDPSLSTNEQLLSQINLNKIDEKPITTTIWWDLYQYDSKTASWIKKVEWETDAKPVTLSAWSTYYDPKTGQYFVAPEKTSTKKKTTSWWVSWVSQWGVLENLTDLRKKDNTWELKFTWNVWNDLNNPWNLVRWWTADKYAIWYVTVVWNDWVSRDFLVFPNLNAWYEWVKSDLQTKISWWSRYVKPTDSLSKLLDVWVWAKWAWQGYKDTVSKISWYDLNAPISSLDASKILEWVKVAEWATTKEWNDYSWLVTQSTQSNYAITPEEINRLNSLSWTSNLWESYRAEQVELQERFEQARDKAKQDIPSFRVLDRLLSSSWAWAWVSDTDVKFLREAFANYLKTWDESYILDSIRDRVLTAKDDSPLKWINDYSKLKLFADAIQNYAKTNDPNFLKSAQTKLWNYFWIATDLSEYNTFLQSGNLNEVLRLAWTSFTDGFIKEVENINISPKDTPEQVAAKLQWLLKKAELEVAPAKTMLWNQVLEQLYPWVFTNTPTVWWQKVKLPSWKEVDVDVDLKEWFSIEWTGSFADLFKTR